MAKKKSKKKQQSPVDILERAEILFNKNSYQAALKEYENYVKLQQDPLPEEVARHIRICEQETAASRSKELIKKARRFLKKGNSAQALVFFEQAYAITGDSQLADKINELRVESGARDMVASVDQAEDAGDYLAAAELLGQLHATNSDNSLLCRRARCLLMAGQWQQAITTYAEADCSSTADLYNAGFALARAQKFVDCLHQWQKIKSEHPDFLAQKEAVHALLFKELTTRLAENPLEREAEIRQQIESLSFNEEPPEARELLARCNCLRLARLWQQGRISEIMEMSDETNPLNVTVLAIHAKAAYQLMQTEGSRLPAPTVRTFIDFWLSALFNPVSGETFFNKGGQDQNRYQVLLDLGAGLVRKYAEYHPESGEQLLGQWQEKYDLLNILNGLGAGSNNNKSIPLYTPALALRAGITEELFLLVRANEDAFPDNGCFLAAGAAYSPAAPFMIMAENQAYDEAITGLDQLDKESGDPFVVYAVARVKFDCGLTFLACGHFTKAEKLLGNTAVLLNQSKNLQKKLLAVLNMEEDWNSDRLTACTNILTVLQKACPSDEIDKALGAVMTRRAVHLFNNKKINVKVLVTSLEKAETLDPTNEFIKFQLNNANCNLEMSLLQKAFDRFKLSEASRIVIKSEHSRVHDMFFDFIYQVCEQAERDAAYESESYTLMLREFLKNVVKIDPSHPIIAELKHKIAMQT